MRIIKNPDTDYARGVQRQIKDNNGYCPCALEKTPDTKCKCKAFREQVKNGKAGECNCGLYIAIQD